MTKMEKMAVIAALVECAFIGYFKHKAAKVITEKAERYFEEEAKRVVARQRHKFRENATESDAPSGAFRFCRIHAKKTSPFMKRKE